jgi:hypothetical protein
MTNPNIHMSLICRINKGACMCFYETIDLSLFFYTYSKQRSYHPTSQSPSSPYPNMAYTDDSMDLSSPPRTPKPTSRTLRPSTPFKSNATVISLDSTPEFYDNNNNNHNHNHNAEHYLTTDFLESIDNNSNDDDFPPGLTSPTNHHNNKIPPLKLFRPRTYIPEHQSPEKMQYTSEVLDHISTSHPPPGPPQITILLLLTPNPASLAEITDLESLATRFSADFGSATHGQEQEWHSVNLYEYFHGWAVRNPVSKSNIEGNASVKDVGIGSIHPYALHAKIEKEGEVNWRLALPIVKNLIDRQVKWGARRFVVCGLKLGAVEGVRGFAREVRVFSRAKRREVRFDPTSAILSS